MRRQLVSATVHVCTHRGCMHTYMSALLFRLRLPQKGTHIGMIGRCAESVCTKSARILSSGFHKLKNIHHYHATENHFPLDGKHVSI